MTATPEDARSGRTEEADAAREVCTISDSTEAVLNLADCIVDLPPHRRTDLDLFDAASVLSAREEDAPFDLLLLSLGNSRQELPKQAQFVASLAAQKSRRLIVVAAEDTSRKLSLPEGTLVLAPGTGRIPAEYLAPHADVAKGPAQPALPEGKKQPKGRASVLGRLLRLARGERDLPVERNADSAFDLALAGRTATITVLGLAGGVGTTTVAVTLAKELARQRSADRICLLDLNLQFGMAASYLNLEDNPRIEDAYRNFRALDADSFEECLTPESKNLTVFSAPPHILPYDALSGKEVTRLIDLAHQRAEIVVVDAPLALADWAGDLYAQSDAVLCIAVQGIRCLRNASKLRELLEANRIGTGNFAFALNRTPEPMPADWAETLDGMEKGLGAKLFHFLAEGGAEVSEACDLGVPLAVHASSNAFYRSIRRLVKTASPSKQKVTARV
ncbi:AAA family ATPase [Pseudodonghicola xiamenensis]|uniref:Pilus assembly protein CpaE n=1 Tax=Pseudodonghicola xiamenensis TaxID=337702 RepID=A0A8J3H972_9RHOB|nr:hypothetical protein [Pseudodonghicola xiamenensis]GHG93825.1 hypothetical protein GCM10010961_26550 [Pseudodonghicola xiamenensis]